MLRRIVTIVAATTVALLVLLVILAYAAFPALQYFSRVRDPVTAKRRGSAIAGLRDRTVVVVVGHPDDADVYAGGLLAILARHENRVVLVVGTSGEKGGNGIPNLARVREREQRNAGKIIGYDRIVFARNPDRGLKNNPHFRDQIRRVFEEEEPDVLLTFDAPSQAIGYRHSDHIAAGAASLAVAKEFPSVRRAYLFSSATPNVLVEVKSAVELKTRAREQHVSQTTGNSTARTLLGILRYLPGLWGGDGRRLMAGSYRDVGVEYGEVYRLVRLR